MFACDHAGRYPRELKTLVPKYLQSIPQCPAAHQDTYSASWRVAGSEGFFFCCSGMHHPGLQANQPYFDARRGMGPESALPPVGCNSQLKTLATCLEMYAADHSGRYPKELHDLTPNYLHHLPHCPGQGAYTYEMHAKPDTFTVRCSTRNHSWYQSTKGLMDGASK